MVRVQSYMEERYLESWPQLMCRIYIRRIEHVYFKVSVLRQFGIVYIRRIEHV